MHWSRLDTITLHQLRVYCTVARLLSYTRAAKELGCQQPTVSALVAELERTTELTLLEQWGKHLALTDEGRELYDHAQLVVAAVDEVWHTVAELRGSASPEVVPLRVAADTTVGTYVLPHLLGAFHRRRSNVLLKLRIANRAEVRASLLAGEADLVIAGRKHDQVLSFETSDNKIPDDRIIFDEQDSLGHRVLLCVRYRPKSIGQRGSPFSANENRRPFQGHPTLLGPLGLVYSLVSLLKSS